MAYMSTSPIRLSPEPSEKMSPRQAVYSTLPDVDAGMQDILIIGYDVNGDLYIRSSQLTRAEAHFMAYQAMQGASESK